MHIKVFKKIKTKHEMKKEKKTQRVCNERINENHYDFSVIATQQFLLANQIPHPITEVKRLPVHLLTNIIASPRAVWVIQCDLVSKNKGYLYLLSK